MLEYLKENLLNKVQKEVETLGVGGLKGKVSDGYHTFDELYEHRVILYIALCKQILRQPYDDVKYKVWRSKKHSDGSEFSGWFIMGIGKDRGEQITYHLPNSKWKQTEFAQTIEFAPNFDGHTSNDVLERITSL